mgnify:CR=1 FL=1
MFNVLNHIHILMQTDVDLASDLLIKYSEILRYQLYNGDKQKVTLEQDIQFLKEIRMMKDIQILLERKYTFHLQIERYLLSQTAMLIRNSELVLLRLLRLTILTILRLVKDITFQRLTYLMMMLQLTILAESMPVWTDTKQEKLW